MIVLAAIALSLVQPNQRPFADLGALFGPDDYPAEARAAGEEGLVGFSVEVAADGRVAGCTVTRPSGSASLDAGTCAILREQARYRPATDGEGRAIAGVDSGRINWRLPPPEPPPVPIPAANCGGCTMPRTNLVSYFNYGDYPPAALRAGEHGRVAFRLLIGTDGRVKRCEVTASSGSQALDRTTCAILLVRARYTPARDPEGNVIEGVDNAHVTWRLPGLR